MSDIHNKDVKYVLIFKTTTSLAHTMSTRYALTWQEQATYRTEVEVAPDQIAAWVNDRGILKDSLSLEDPERSITSEDIVQMQLANPHFHQAIIKMYVNEHLVLTPETSRILSAVGQSITAVQQSPKH